MRPCSKSVTPSRFQRKLPGGRHDRLFRFLFGGDGAAARFLGVNRMRVWRWRHGADLPDWVAELLTHQAQKAVEQAHEVQDDLRHYRAEPTKPPQLSGCCAGYGRKLKTIPRTDAEWAAMGY
jgi:hypothetical protein